LRGSIQELDVRIAVDGLELTDEARTDVAHFKHRIAGEFLLNPQAEGHRVWVAEIGVNAGLTEQARVAAISARRSVELRGGVGQEREIDRTRTAWRLADNACGGIRRRRHRVEHDVEEPRIVSDSEVAAHNKPAVGETRAEPLEVRRIGEADPRRD